MKALIGVMTEYQKSDTCHRKEGTHSVAIEPEIWFTSKGSPQILSKQISYLNNTAATYAAVYPVIRFSICREYV